MTEFVPAVQRHRTGLATAFDALVWVSTFMGWMFLRLEGVVESYRAVFVMGVIAALAHVVVGRVVRLHQGRARTASLEEMILLGFVTFSVGMPLFVANLIWQWVPRSVPLAATFASLILMGFGRALWRWLRERDMAQVRSEGATRVLVIGAGMAASDLIDSMLGDPARAWRPVAMVDDDPAKRHRRHRGVPVLGTTEQLTEVAERCEVTSAIIAIPSASAADVERLSRLAVTAGLAVKVLPGVNELLDARIDIRDIRDINLNDVLGRNQIDTDIASIAGYLSGKRVLVTGAGGSIGSELCRQISRFDPAELMMLDRDESALHSVQLSLQGRALLDSDDVILCDIRDLTALTGIFESRRPEVVFHAAALKHLPMLEQFPDEAVKTNVLGTRNVLHAASAVGVQRFVNISTDKAANPCSVLGYSKRIAERITAAYALEADGTYLSVRFGNVLGSRGSVLTAFAKQIAAGGPVTVTDPNVTRYFMTIEEACQLVVQAAAIGRPAEALVLEMGEPIRILDVAQQLIRQSGSAVEIEFTGLRPGEKLHEELFGDDEPQDLRPEHPMVSHVPVPAVSDGEIEALPRYGDRQDVTRSLAALCLVMRVDSSRG